MLAEDVILARELGRLGGIGARLVARWLPTNVGERQVTVSARVDEVRAAIWDAFGAQMEDALPDGSIRVLVGAGRLNLNPALVTFTPGGSGPAGTVVRVRGAAKEGWVKQRAGEQAADRATAWLSATFNSPAPPPEPPRAA